MEDGEETSLSLSLSLWAHVCMYIYIYAFSFCLWALFPFLHLVVDHIYWFPLHPSAIFNVANLTKRTKSPQSWFPKLLISVCTFQVFENIGFVSFEYLLNINPFMAMSPTALYIFIIIDIFIFDSRYHWLPKVAIGKTSIAACWVNLSRRALGTTKTLWVIICKQGAPRRLGLPRCGEREK